MQSKIYKKCDRCGKIFDVSPFACMLGNGERADASIEIHGDKYDLCPKCTYKIWEFLNEHKNVPNKNGKVVNIASKRRLK